MKIKNSIVRRRTVRRRNKPSLKTVIMAGILSQFSYSGYSDSILEEPQKIRDAMQELCKDTQLWANLQLLAEAIKNLKEIKEGY
jgi:hypothetical protein